VRWGRGEKGRKGKESITDPMCGQYVVSAPTGANFSFAVLNTPFFPLYPSMGSCISRSSIRPSLATISGGLFKVYCHT
jgi:hypothetical protein